MFINQPDAATFERLCKGSPGEHWIESLDDGTHVLIRPLAAQDREREFQFIKHLSAQSCRFRFLGRLTEAGASLMDPLMDLDYHDRMSYVALAHEDGQLHEVGVSRYAARHGHKQCECAVAVADQWQRRGLGRLLMKHLIDAARRNGFEKMTSTNLPTNYAIHRLLKKLDFESYYPTVDFTEVVHKLHL